MQLIDRFWKYASAAARPAFWPALRRGVMPGIEHLRALEPLNPASIVDVGANKGQFSTAVRYLFPNARIYAFEPLSSEFARYRHVVSGAVETFDCALGDSEKTIDFFVTSRRDSSSIFKPFGGQDHPFDVKLSHVVKLKQRKIIDVLDLKLIPKPVLLKLDVQGAELSVLRGFGAQLFEIANIYCEVSFVPLYEGQPLASAIVDYLWTYGYTIKGVFNQSLTREGTPAQADFLFAKATPSVDPPP